MEIRFAKPQDVAGIIRLLQQVGQIHQAGRPDIFRNKAQKYSPSQIFNMLDRKDTPVFVAAEGEKVLGYGFCQLQVIRQDPVFRDRISLYVDDLCVAQDCRRQHIGTALYQHILRYAGQHGCYDVSLNVWNCNAEALAFYAAMGMKTQKVGLEVIL